MARRRLIVTIGVGLAAVTGVAAVGTATMGGRPSDQGERVEQVHLAAPALGNTRAGTTGTAPTTSAAATCSVRYAVNGRHDGTFAATVTLGSAAPARNWRLSWTYPGDQQVGRVAGARWRQKGADVTLAGRAALRPGRVARLRLTGRSGTSAPAGAVPSAFRLNGQACTVLGGAAPGASTTGAPRPTITTNPRTTSTTSGAPTTSPGMTHTTTPSTTATTRSTTATTRSTTATTRSTTATTATTSTSATGGGQILGTGRIQYGKAYPGVATFYSADGSGNCMFEAGGDLMVGAMNHTDYENSQACGAFVQVVGPKGTITVKIVDQCPECKAGHIDLSAQAFAKIANPVDGIVPITWRLLSPELSGPIAYRFKEGSSQWWCGVQIRDHRNPVRSVEFLVGSTWKQLPRQDYNYFSSADGSGCGSQIRATDIYGNQVISSDPVAVRPGVVQPGRGQFGPPR